MSPKNGGDRLFGVDFIDENRKNGEKSHRAKAFGRPNLVEFPLRVASRSSRSPCFTENFKDHRTLYGHHDDGIFEELALFKSVKSNCPLFQHCI